MVGAERRPAYNGFRYDEIKAGGSSFVQMSYVVHGALILRLTQQLTCVDAGYK